MLALIGIGQADKQVAFRHCAFESSYPGSTSPLGRHLLALALFMKSDVYFRSINEKSKNNKRQIYDFVGHKPNEKGRRTLGTLHS